MHLLSRPRHFPLHSASAYLCTRMAAAHPSLLAASHIAVAKRTSSLPPFVPATLLFPIRLISHFELSLASP